METIAVWTLKLIVPALVVGGLYVWADRANKSTCAHAKAKAQQSIAVNKVIYGVLVVIFGAIAFGIGHSVYSYRHFYSDGNIAAGSAVAGFFAICAIVLAQYMARSYRVQWDDFTIEGPSAYRLPPFGAKRLRLNYNQIDGLGVDWAEQLCIYRADGRAIKFSHFYPGYTVVVEQLERKRPDLFIDNMSIDDA